MNHQETPGGTTPAELVVRFLSAEPPPEQPPTWTPRVGAITAYRMWQVQGPEDLPLGTLGELTLHSMASTEELWPPNQEWLEARCPQHGVPDHWRSAPRASKEHAAEDTPAPGCCCGLYADDASPKALSRATSTFGPTVVGRVEFAGHVVIHERGFRAQRGRIMAVRVLPSKIEQLQTWLVEKGLLLAGYPVIPWTECSYCSARLVERMDADEYRCPHGHEALSGAEISHGWR